MMPIGGAGGISGGPSETSSTSGGEFRSNTGSVFNFGSQKPDYTKLLMIAGVIVVAGIAVARKK